MYCFVFELIGCILIRHGKLEKSVYTPITSVNVVEYFI